MKKLFILLLAACFANAALASSDKVPNLEIWYKGVKNPKKDKKRLSRLPRLYYTAGTLDDFENMAIDPFNLSYYIEPSFKKTLDLDPSQGRRIIISDKKKLGLDDEIDVMTFGPNKTLYVRIRALEPKEKGKFPIGPYKDSIMLDIAPQTGKLKGLLSKSDSGYSLKNNVKKSDIEVRRMKLRDALPYAVPQPPPPPKPAPKVKGVSPQRKGYFEFYNRAANKPIYYVLSDDKNPISKTTKITGKIKQKGGTSNGYFDDTGHAQLYISPVPFNELKEGQEVTYYTFAPRKDLFLVAEPHPYYKNFQISSYILCGKRLPIPFMKQKPQWVIDRCKKYGVKTYGITKLTGIYKGGVILKKTA